MPESLVIVTFRPHVFYPKSIEKTCVQKGKDVKTLCSCADLCGGCVHIHRAVGTYGDIGDFPHLLVKNTLDPIHNHGGWGKM